MKQEQIKEIAEKIVEIEETVKKDPTRETKRWAMEEIEKIVEPISSIDDLLEIDEYIVKNYHEIFDKWKNS